MASIVLVDGVSHLQVNVSDPSYKKGVELGEKTFSSQVIPSMLLRPTNISPYTPSGEEGFRF